MGSIEVNIDDLALSTMGCESVTNHPQANGIVEHNHRVLRDSLRALILHHGQGGCDELLPHIINSYKGNAYCLLPHKQSSQNLL